MKAQMMAVLHELTTENQLSHLMIPAYSQKTHKHIVFVSVFNSVSEYRLTACIRM